MKPTEFLKVAAIAAMTSGLIAGCQQSSSDDMPAEPMAEEECMGATPEARNAIYAAKLKNARARNLGAEWEENAKIIEEAEQAAADCENVRAKILAEKAEESAAEAIAMMQANIERRAAENNLKNIHAVLSEQKNTRLDADSIDMAFVCNTYHHFEYPQSMLASIHRALRPGGTLVIIDYRKHHGTSSSWVMSHVRSGEQSVIKEIEQAGFKLHSESDILKENYFLRFVKE